MKKYVPLYEDFNKQKITINKKYITSNGGFIIKYRRFSNNVVYSPSFMYITNDGIKYEVSAKTVNSLSLIPIERKIDNKEIGLNDNISQTDGVEEIKYRLSTDEDSIEYKIKEYKENDAKVWVVSTTHNNKTNVRRFIEILGNEIDIDSTHFYNIIDFLEKGDTFLNDVKMDLSKGNHLLEDGDVTKIFYTFK